MPGSHASMRSVSTQTVGTQHTHANTRRHAQTHANTRTHTQTHADTRMHKQTWCKQGVDMGDDPLKEATVEGLGKCVSADNGHLARIRAANRFAAGKRGLGCQGARQLLCIQPKKLRNCSTRRVACRDGQKERERVCVCVCVRERECVCVCVNAGRKSRDNKRQGRTSGGDLRAACDLSLVWTGLLVRELADVQNGCQDGMDVVLLALQKEEAEHDTVGSSEGGRGSGRVSIAQARQSRGEKERPKEPPPQKKKLCHTIHRTPPQQNTHTHSHTHTHSLSLSRPLPLPPPSMREQVHRGSGHSPVRSRPCRGP